MRFDVVEVEGNRIEKIAVWFQERPEPRRRNDELLFSPEDQIE
jgi:hypothetical protein